MKRIRRSASAGILLIVLLSLIPGVLFAQSSTAQELQSQDVAILLKGPEYGQRLPFFQPNAIEYYAGYYSFRDQEIIVYYTDRDIVRFEEWEPAACNSVGLFRINPADPVNAAGSPGLEDSATPAGSGPVVYFYQNGTYVLFFSFAEGLNCSFIERFLLRFDYFRSARSIPSKRPPFPAVVE